MVIGHLSMTNPKEEKKLNKNTEHTKRIALHLSIQIRLDGLSFCIIDKEAKEVIRLGNHDFKEAQPNPVNHLKYVQEVFEKESALSRGYGSFNVTHENPWSGLVPKALFNEERLKDYVRYSTKTYDNDYLVYDEVEPHELINVYIPFVNINNYLLDQLGGFEYKHYSTILLSNLLNTYKYSEHPHLFFHLGSKRLSCVAIRDQKLLLYNTYPYHTAQDLLYYILFVAEQLGMDPKSLELLLSGQIEKEDPFFKLCHQYVRNVSLLENRFDKIFDSKVSELSKRKHFTLLNQF